MKQRKLSDKKIEKLIEEVVACFEVDCLYYEADTDYVTTGELGDNPWLSWGEDLVRFVETRCKDAPKYYLSPYEYHVYIDYVFEAELGKAIGMKFNKVDDDSLDTFFDRLRERLEKDRPYIKGYLY